MSNLYLTGEARKLRNAFNAHKKTAKRRFDRLGNPIQFKLSWEQWLEIWSQSGQINNRGTRRNQYVMARNDDIGHYEVGNVAIKTASENVREATRFRSVTRDARD